jgi:type IV pilus assembly protein PilA
MKRLATRGPSALAGFTMVEMMAVVAVIAILATLAIPSFQNRIVRAQIVEAVTLADIAKPPVAVAWAASQPMPVDNAAAGLPSADKIVGNLVTSVAVDNGAIDITFGNHASSAIRGKVLTLRPAVVTDTPIVPIAWLCGHAGAVDKMTAMGVDRTDVPEQFLPLNCRPGP